MSRDRTQLEAEYAVRATNLAYALFAAKNLDAINCAIGIATMATTIVDADPIARTMLARALVRLANELDHDVIDADWQ